MINISYGICVGKTHDKDMLKNLIISILKQDIDFFEILLIGEDLEEWNKFDNYIRVIPFDESVKPGWITKKKNILAQESKYHNVCIMHDYYLLSNHWIEGVRTCSMKVNNWKNHYQGWDILVCEALTKELHRHSAWNVSPKRMQEVIDTNPDLYVPMLMAAAPHENGPQYVNGLPYTVQDLTHIQYISGGFIFCKKDVLLDVPLNESMIWGDAPGEDVEWSERLSQKGYLYTFNPYSRVSCQKPNKWRVFQMPNEFVEVLRGYYGTKTRV
jgi:hypothetical protein